MPLTLFCMALLLLVGLLFFKTAKDRGICNGDAKVAEWAAKVYEVAGKHTQVTGLLAGFNITVIILFTALGVERAHDDEDLLPVQVVTSLFMTSYFGYVATGVLFAIVIERAGQHRLFLFVAACCLYYFSLTASFTALLPLVQLMNFESLEVIVLVMILASLTGGYLSLVIPHHDLLRLRRRVLFCIPFAALACTGLLHQGLMLFSGPDPTNILLQVVLPLSCVAVGGIFATCMLTFYWQGLSTPKSFVGFAVAFTLLTLTLCLFIPLELVRLWFLS